MLSDKENQETPKPSEVKKRPSVQSSFTAGTPSTRPGPREMKSCQLIRDGDVNVVCTREVIETIRSYGTDTSDPSPLIVMTEDPELEAGDIKHEANERGVPTGPFASPFPDVSRDGAVSQKSGVPRCLDWEASPVYPQRKYNMNDSEISFLIKENEVLQEEENRLAQVEAEYEFIVDLKKKRNKQLEDLQSKCAVVEEQLEEEKLARDAADREIVQLRDEKNAAIEALEKAKTALTDAEDRAVAAERNLKDHIKCHTEELNLRVTELQNKLAECLTDKKILTLQLEEKVEKQATLTCELEKASELIFKLEVKVTLMQKDNQVFMRGIAALISASTKAEDVWKQKEQEYKQKISAAEEVAEELKQQIKNLEERLTVEESSANEKESAVESAATPNRSLRTTLYKKLAKIVKLSDTPESKASTSRCIQQ